MSPQFLSASAGLILSLAFSYIPNLSTAYHKQSGETKRLIMLALILIISTTVYVFTCLYPLDGAPPCVTPNYLDLASNIFAAAIANQTAYQLSPKS